MTSSKRRWWRGLPRDRKARVHVLFESSDGTHPFGSSFIRLLRPLKHNSNQRLLELSSSAELSDVETDVVIVDRLWRHDIAADKLLSAQQELVSKLQTRSIPLLYSLDDNLLDLRSMSSEFPTEQHKLASRRFLKASAGTIVSTVPLSQRVSRLTRSIVVPNCLDEGLFEGTEPFATDRPRGEKIRFGYMGTFTHLADLLSVLWPLRAFLDRHRDRVEFEIIGVADAAEVKNLFPDLPVVHRFVPPSSVAYPEFVKWMKCEVDWQFAIAPLEASPLNECKSDIKFLDYSFLGIPGVYSQSQAYGETVKHADNGLLANAAIEWLNSLEIMAFDEAARARMRRNASAYVRAERTLSATACRWWQAIEELVGYDASAMPTESRATARGSMTRQEKVLFGLQMEKPGLEIGPSYSPIAPKRDGFNVMIVDHADADALKAKYGPLGIDVSRIEAVDFIWRGEELVDLVGRPRFFSWIIASHLIEHTPDLISFLRNCGDLLADDGILSLVVPDYRYCFDRYRTPTTPGQLIDAYMEKRQRHSIGTIWDHFSLTVRNGGDVSWTKQTAHRDFSLLHSVDDAVRIYDQAKSSTEYIDVHNWRFTPESFRFLIDELVQLRLSNLQVINVFDTEGCEFFVQLRISKHPSELISPQRKLELLQKAYPVPIE
jgi:predicted SAM-dependent methyltransferase